MCYCINKSATDALTEKELADVQWFIEHQRNRGETSSAIIKKLQKFNHKLSNLFNAERAFWTEVKRAESVEVLQLAAKVGIKEYKVILSPSACELCSQKTEHGEKVFSTREMYKSGYGHIPPFHPNCYCIAIPI